MLNNILKNKAEIEERIGEARDKGGFNQEVKLVAVTKYQTKEDTLAVIEAGIHDIGENYVQALQEKDEWLPSCNRHFIGHLQTNKVKHLLAMNDISLIQSVDSVHLAKEIDKQSLKLGRKTDVLIQVNMGDEIQKFGIDKKDTESMLRSCSEFENIKIHGLMATMPIEKDLSYYKEFREIFDKMKSLNIPNIDMDILSMGMSNDYEEAVLCGSTMVRIGTALFK